MEKPEFKKEKDLVLKIDDKHTVHFTETSYRFSISHYTTIGSALERYKCEYDKLTDKPDRNIEVIDGVINVEKEIIACTKLAKTDLIAIDIDGFYNVKTYHHGYMLFRGSKSCDKYGKFGDVLHSYYTIVIRKSKYSSLNDVLEHQKRLLEMFKKFC